MLTVCVAQCDHSPVAGIPRACGERWGDGVHGPVAQAQTQLVEQACHSMLFGWAWLEIDQNEEELDSYKRECVLCYLAVPFKDLNHIHQLSSILHTLLNDFRRCQLTVRFFRLTCKLMLAPCGSLLHRSNSEAGLRSNSFATATWEKSCGCNWQYV